MCVCVCVCVCVREWVSVCVWIFVEVLGCKLCKLKMKHEMKSSQSDYYIEMKWSEEKWSELKKLLVTLFLEIGIGIVKASTGGSYGIPWRNHDRYHRTTYRLAQQPVHVQAGTWCFAAPSVERLCSQEEERSKKKDYKTWASNFHRRAPLLVNLLHNFLWGLACNWFALTEKIRYICMNKN